MGRHVKFIPTTDINEPPSDAHKGYENQILTTNGSSFPVWTMNLNEPMGLKAEFGSMEPVRFMESSSEKDQEISSVYKDAYFGEKVTIKEPVVIKKNPFHDMIDDMYKESFNTYHQSILDDIQGKQDETQRRLEDSLMMRDRINDKPIPFGSYGNFKVGDIWDDNAGNKWLFQNGAFTSIKDTAFIPPFNPKLLSMSMPLSIKKMFTKLNPFKKQENPMCRETKDSKKKDAYVVTWTDKEGHTKMRIPTKADIGIYPNNYSPCDHTTNEYLYDYKDVEAFVRKYLSEEKSNILISKAVNMIEVKLHEVD